MKIIISNIIQIKEPTAQLLDWVKTNLVFKNPDYTKRVQMGFYVGNLSKYISLFNYSDGILSVPSGCYEKVMSFCSPDDEIFDNRSEKPGKFVSKIVLREYQKPAIIPFTTRIHHQDNGLIIIPCGLGKTQIALEIASRLNQKTLFLTHTRELLNQAKKRCENNVKCSISTITEGKVDMSGDFVVGTVQTVVMKLDEIPRDTFGLVIIDEIHRLGCNAKSIGMFRECCEYFMAKYKIGLTATLHRADGLSDCIPYIVGNIAYEIIEDKEDYVGYLGGKELIRFPKSQFQVPAKVEYISSGFTIQCYKNGREYFKDVFNKDGMTISFAKLLNCLTSDEDRNNIIINIANNTKGSTIILSDRVEQLKILQSKISSSVLVTGDTNKKIREKALDDVSNGNIRVLCSSYKLAKEGLDIPRLSNIILASPVKDEAVVIQSIGRIQRPFEGKEIAMVYDITDNQVSTLTRFFRKRNALYKKKGWL